MEYGTSNAYGQRTSLESEARWSHLHHIGGLTPATRYHYRIIIFADGRERAGPEQTFTTARFERALRIPGDIKGPPYKLDRSSGFYVLEKDIFADGTAIEITGRDVLLELDGHTVWFGMNSADRVFGVVAKGQGSAVIRNGHLVQGAAAGVYSACVEKEWRDAAFEVYGVTAKVHRPDGYPLRVVGAGQAVHLHHNRLLSSVTEIESRHYPGNDLLRIHTKGSDVSVHDNLLSEGAHRAIWIGGAGGKIEIAHNDIRHHARYVNGYALSLAASGGMDVHHNRVTSVGRGAHLTAPDIRFHHNYMDLKGHMTLDDMPQGHRPFQEMRIELHGIKLEGRAVRGAKIYQNYTRVTQPLPDERWDYVPATALNISSYDPNAMNEVYANTFVALTEYRKTHHGPYGAAGQWAAAIYLVAMVNGPAESGKHSVYVHDNSFVSNDLFVAATQDVNMTLRIEKNTFLLSPDLPPTDGHARYRNIGPALREAIERGDNDFRGM